MALRLIEIVLSEAGGESLQEGLREHPVVEYQRLRLQGGTVLVRILLDAENTEAVLDLVDERYQHEEGYRVVVLPVEATLPRVEPEAAPEGESAEAPGVDPSPERIGREELYEDIKDAARCTRVYLAMVVLSTIVATVGLYSDSVGIIIGAMVIAPLLGPNVALALSTTLGDLTLLWRAFLAVAAGTATTVVLSLLIGWALPVNVLAPEISARIGVSAGDVIVALASGCAGTLAFTTGVSTTLIGVMVAVALLPPLVTFGLLLGGGHSAAALGALSLFLMNLVCVNLAGVVTFLLQGIRPAVWWEKDRAAKATRIAIVLWAGLLATLLALVLLLRHA